MYGICLVLFLATGAISLVGADEYKETDLKQWNAAFVECGHRRGKTFSQCPWDE